LSGFDVKLVVSDPVVPAQAITEAGGQPTDLESLLRCSDYVCLFLPLTSATHYLIGRAQLALMKPTAYLINTSRGALVDQHALAEALEQGVIAGAGLDVLEVEPPPPHDPLLRTENVIITPHVAWYSEESVHDNRIQAAEEVVRVLSGQPPIHPVVLTLER
jgi:phosphoglycerate dehydrogenase-like enzyme